MKYILITMMAMISMPLFSQVTPSDCKEGMFYFDFENGMCMPMAMAGMPMKMWMLHADAFVVQNFAEKPRGKNQLAAPNMFMADIGSNLGEMNYLNFELMLSAEKWTFPEGGNPLLLQIGEKDKNGRPFIDAQHPHSSPIMGLTLSDTVSLGDKDFFKLYFAPRGQATEGPIFYLHRASGMNNPDTPLGHHIGQDVSHISSTVVGASLHVGPATLESSLFHGEEPEPEKTDLPMGKLNSYATRLIWNFTDNFYLMGSAATIKDPEKDDPAVKEVKRYSGSLYYHFKFFNQVQFHNTLILGLTNFYDHHSRLRSINEEFNLASELSPHNIWGRIEALERGSDQLAIAGPAVTKWVEAATLGYTYDILEREHSRVSVGGSVTKNILPSEFDAAYGGDPMAGKIFLQFNSMLMGNW